MVFIDISIANNLPIKNKVYTMVCVAVGTFGSFSHFILLTATEDQK